MQHCQVRFAFLPWNHHGDSTPGEVVSGIQANHYQFKFQKGQPCANGAARSQCKESIMNANLNFCGIVNLLQQLVDAEIFTVPQAKRIADRIAKKMGATFVYSIES